MQGRSLLLTGATGILGSWVLAEALDRGYEPIALMRDSDPAKAKERIATVLDLVERRHLLDRVRILRGDASQPHLGLDGATRSELRATLGAAIHCAACTSFSADDDDDVLSTNIGGVENMVALFSGTDVPFYHVSTAYVAGRREGLCREDELEHDAGFNNTYERSKNLSERIVRNAFEEGRVRGAIFRPAIIVGAAGDGRIAQFMNFYNFIQVLEFALMRRRRGPSNFLLNANPHCTKNLAAVDWTAQAMMRIVDTEGPNGHTYHLTNPNPPTHAFLVEWGNRILAEAGMKIEFADRGPAAGPSFKQAMRGNYEQFEAYLETEPVFDRTNTDRALGGALPFPHVDLPHLDNMIEYARSNRWRSIFGKRAKADTTYINNIVPVDPAKAKAAIA